MDEEEETYTDTEVLFEVVYNDLINVYLDS